MVTILLTMPGNDKSPLTARRVPVVVKRGIYDQGSFADPLRCVVVALRQARSGLIDRKIDRYKSPASAGLYFCLSEIGNGAAAPPGL
jgi:hypothetical protein